MDNIVEIGTSQIDKHAWLKFFSMIITIALMLFLLYVAIRYPIPYLWHMSKILAILFIPIYLFVLYFVGFGCALFVFYSTLLVLIITVRLILLSKNLALCILASITKSHRLYSWIEPTWVPSLLLKVPTAQAFEVLKKMKAEHVYHVLQSKKGLSLLMKLPVSESVKILKKMGGLQVYHILHNETGLSLFMKLPISEIVRIFKGISLEQRGRILLSEDLKRDPQYPSFLRSIPPSMIDECQYSLHIEKRRRFVRDMYNLGIKINVFNCNKTTEGV